MRWINYQHYFYFWSVARFGSITEASRQLRLSQPTISVQLKAFEEILGVALFERGHRKLRLTEAGEIAFKYGQQIFGLGQELLDVLEGKAENNNKEFRIGISDVVPKSLAYRLIEPSFKLEAGHAVSCFEDKTERLLAELAIGGVDIVISDRPIPPSVHVKAYNHFVGESGVSFLGLPAHVSSFRRGFPNSLSAAPLLLPTNEAAIRIELNFWFEKLNIRPQSVISFQDRSLMKIAAREGQGILPVPSILEREIRAEFHLECIGRTNDVKERWYVISLERRLRNPTIVAILSQGRKSLFRR